MKDLTGSKTAIRKILFWRLGALEEQGKENVPRYLLFCKEFKAGFINDSEPLEPWFWP